MKLLRWSKKTLEQDKEITTEHDKGITKDELDTKDVNPFKLPKDERYIDPNDPNRSIDEQKRLRRNWNRRRNYHKKKTNQKQKDEATEILAKAIEEIAKKKKKNERPPQTQRAQVE